MKTSWENNEIAIKLEIWNTFKSELSSLHFDCPVQNVPIFPILPLNYTDCHCFLYTAITLIYLPISFHFLKILLDCHRIARYRLTIMWSTMFSPDCYKSILLSFWLGASSLYQNDIWSYMQLFLICRRLGETFIFIG